MEKGDVLRHWSKEFNALLTPPPPTADMQRHMHNITTSNRQREKDDNFNIHAPYNTPFDIDEISKLVKHAKANKAPGIDGVT